jgi:hypothetical protein
VILTDIVTAAIAQLIVELDVKRALERALNEKRWRLFYPSIVCTEFRPGVTKTGEACGGLGNTTETLFGILLLILFFFNFLISLSRINVSLCGRLL